MILDRTPRQTPLKISDLFDVSLAVSKWEKEASEKLEILHNEPALIDSSLGGFPVLSAPDLEKSPESDITLEEKQAAIEMVNLTLPLNDNATSNFQTSVIRDGQSNFLPESSLLLKNSKDTVDQLLSTSQVLALTGSPPFQPSSPVGITSSMSLSPLQQSNIIQT